MSIEPALQALLPTDHPMADLTGKTVMASFFMPLDELGPINWIVTEDGCAYGSGVGAGVPVYCKVGPEDLHHLLEDVVEYATALASNAAFSMRNIEMCRVHFAHLIPSDDPREGDTLNSPFGVEDLDDSDGVGASGLGAPDNSDDSDDDVVTPLANTPEA